MTWSTQGDIFHDRRNLHPGASPEAGRGSIDEGLTATNLRCRFVSQYKSRRNLIRFAMRMVAWPRSHYRTNAENFNGSLVLN